MSRTSHLDYLSHFPFPLIFLKYFLSGVSEIINAQQFGMEHFRQKKKKKNIGFEFLRCGNSETDNNNNSSEKIAVGLCW